MKINWNFLGGGGCKTKKLPWGENGYFLELYINTHIKKKKKKTVTLNNKLFTSQTRRLKL